MNIYFKKKTNDNWSKNGIKDAMLFTGKHDKQGNMIYEGDIVIGFLKHNGVGYPDNGTLKEGKWTVVWSKIRCGFCLEGISGYGSRRYALNGIIGIEVIGNIHDSK